MPQIKGFMANRVGKMVVLDGYTNNPGDISWQDIQAYGHLEIYDRSNDANWLSRAREAEILLVNKFVLDAGRLRLLPNLRCIIVLATGYNNIDLKTCRERSVRVYNAVGYAGDSVAQYVITAILAWQVRLESHVLDVKQGGWSQCPDFSYTLNSIREITGMQLGIVGFGKIGQAVGRKAHALGMRVVAQHTHPDRDQQPWMKMVSREELFATSDVVSLHVPLNETTTHLINTRSLALMKPQSLLINTGRGGLVDETALQKALSNQVIQGAVLDVLDQEPPGSDHPFFAMPNCWVTPHMAWTSREARQRLIEISGENIGHYLAGKATNRVV